VTRYELLDRIGVGGMAEIFRGKAVAAGGFEKPVAIKRILPHLAQDERFVELLIAEAKVLSLLKHRNIVQIFDVGLGDDGKYFLVMEYVDGKDLGAVQRGLEARRWRLPYDLVLHVGAEICEALEHAHSARAPDGKPMSLVHRDVSPSNVLLSRAGEVKLTDFGIAKRAEQEATGHGAVRGKFAYISPEQARNQHIEPRSDVFSVGLLLWELVTNRRLFSGLGDMEALRAVREAKVPRPREFDAQVSPEIDALIMSALSPEPRGRPTAGQLCARLRTLRYSLEVTVGDPATELAKTIEAAEEYERESAKHAAPSRAEFELSEATVIRIHTADAFSTDEDGPGLARARAVIDRFEEEETRQSRLSRDQMAFLRANAERDSEELAQAVDPPLPGLAPRRASDEMTRAREPVIDDLAMTFPPGGAPDDASDPGDSGEHFEAQATRLLPPDRRTPLPERQPRPATAPPVAMPAPRMRAPTPASPVRLRHPTPGLAQTPPPGTVHDRGGWSPPPGIAASIPMPPPPAMQATPVVMMVPSLVSPPPMPAVVPPTMPLPAPVMAAALPPGLLPSSLAQASLPSSLAQASLPPLAQASLPPALMSASPLVPPAPGWPIPGQPPVGVPPAMQALYERRPRHGSQVRLRRRRSSVQPWMLVIGALIMALLAFAVTRACIHTATRAIPESRAESR
jgi:serine/threonine-protein kinase